jgi:precorrin-6B methylase 2
MHNNIDAALAPSRGSLRERDNRFYHLLAGGAKTRLLETFLDLGLPELLGKNGAMTSATICDELKLDPHRGWKFLHLLSLIGMLDRDGAPTTNDDARFNLSAQAKQFFGDNGKGGYYFRDLVVYWRNVACLPMIDVLRGMELPAAVRWPPPGLEQAEHLETWMRVTATGAVATLKNSHAIEGARRLLDVGGGDGTIGCALADVYPELDVTVFNLPASAILAQKNIEQKNRIDRVHVHEGNFLTDELPGGFDRILFSRVLCDWTPEVCEMLFEKSRRALAPDGRLVINEALIEGNADYTISWEFRYVFYDTFGRMLFKTLDVYKRLLTDAGFAIERVCPMRDDAFYSVIIARPA